MLLYMLLLFLKLVISLDDNSIRDLTFTPCPNTHDNDKRILYVATCDTRGGWKEFQALKVWNATGVLLRQQGYYYHYHLY